MASGVVDSLSNVISVIISGGDISGRLTRSNLHAAEARTMPF